MVYKPAPTNRRTLADCLGAFANRTQRAGTVITIPQDVWDNFIKLGVNERGSEMINNPTPPEIFVGMKLVVTEPGTDFMID